MPIYEYECRSCGLRKEVLQRVSDDPLVVCPECNQASFVKKVSVAGFRLKGTGWYETDFKDKKPAVGKDKEAAPSEGAGSGAADAAKDKSDTGSKTQEKTGTG